MKSFPSALNEAQNMYGSTRSQSFEATFDIERIKHGALNLNKSIPVVQEMLKQTNINISNYQKYPNMRTVANPSTMISGSSRDYKNIGEREYEGTEYNKDGSQKTVKYKGMDGDMVPEDREEAIFYENPLLLLTERCQHCEKSVLYRLHKSGCMNFLFRFCFCISLPLFHRQTLSAPSHNQRLYLSIVI